MSGPTVDRSRRLRWIAASLRIDLRPATLAERVRMAGGDPPSLDNRSPEAIASARAIERAAAASDCDILTPDEGGWMSRLWCELIDPPVSLYLRGRLHPPDQSAVAIVGTRHPSPAGVAIARVLARDLASRGYPVVSGLALGIDAAAHRGALDADGCTIGVLGGGVDRPAPRSNARLAESMLARGGLVSEFPLGVDPRPLHFPRRNRIIAALASVVVVVEGGRRSGARSTVDHALALGREVLAVPRDPIHEGAALPNELLRSGAAPVVSAEDLIDHLGSPMREVLPAGDAGPEEAVLALVARRATSLEEIRSAIGAGEAAAAALLGRMELDGRIRRRPGLSYEAGGRR